MLSLIAAMGRSATGDPLALAPALAVPPTPQQGLPRSAADWVSAYQALAQAAPADCAAPALPSLDPRIPAQAFPLAEAVRAAASLPTATPESAPLIVSSRDPNAARLIVLAVDGQGCVHIGSSGRALRFHSRSIHSPYPNTRLPAALGAITPVAIVADAKAIRAWIRVEPEPAFRALSIGIWGLMGMFMGMLLVLLLVAGIVQAIRPNPLARAYGLYIGALLIYQFQNFGLGAAWLPFWPSPSYGLLLQTAAAAIALAGVTTMAVTFLKPGGWLRPWIITGFCASALGFLSANLAPGGYHVGALAFLMTATVVMVLAARRLGSGRLAARWFAAGFGAFMVAATLQTATVLTGGSGLPAASAFGVAGGNLVEALCWLIALVLHLHQENLALQRRLVFEAERDPLTGRYGRAFLRARIQDALAAAQRNPGRRSSLLFIDLDGFKAINDRLGHARGDAVLTAVADVLGELGRDDAIVGRFGGDEFMLLQPEDPHGSRAEGAAAALLTRLRDLDNWQRRGLWRQGQYVGINVQGRQLIDDTLPEQLEQALDRHPVDPGSLRIDIAERALRTDSGALRRVARRLLGHGVQVGVDDVGSGLSSLTLIGAVEPDYLKLDGRVVAGLPHLPRTQDMARTVQLVATELGCTAIAEGIEHWEQQHFLTIAGFQQGQGHALSPPLPPEELEPWLRRSQRRHLESLPEVVSGRVH